MGETMPGSELRAREPIWPIEEYGGGMWVKARPGDPAPGSTPTARTGPTPAQYQLWEDPSYWPVAAPDTAYLEPKREPSTFVQKVAPITQDPDAGLTALFDQGLLQPYDAPRTTITGKGETVYPTSTLGLDWSSPDALVGQRQTTADGYLYVVRQPIEPEYTGNFDMSGTMLFLTPEDAMLWGTAGANDVLYRVYVPAGSEIKIQTNWGNSGAGLWYGYDIDHPHMVQPFSGVTAKGLGLEVHDVHPLTQVPVSEEVLGSPIQVHGRNPGADWPVLHQQYGIDWIFKARHGTPIGDLNPARQLAGPTATKIASLLEVPVAPEVPFQWEGVKGTIQPFMENAGQINLDIGSLRLYQSMADNGGPEIVKGLQEHHLVDWLTSQHDSNSDAFLASAVDGMPVAIDKGQAWLFFNEGHEAAAFNSATGEGYWLYGRDPRFPNPQAADVHLGEYLYNAHNTGVRIERSAVEPLLQRIEAIPEQTWREILRPLAEARVATGRFEATVEEFLDAAVARKNAMRGVVNKAYEHLGQITLAPAGEMNVWRPGAMGSIDIGGPEWMNSQFKKPVRSPTFVEPELPDLTNRDLLVGVIVEEPDGRIFAVQSKPGAMPDRYFPRTRVEAGKDPATVAQDYVARHLGIATRLEEHIADIPGGTTVTTRWYRATRIGGGPFGSELNRDYRILLGTPDQIRVNPMTAELVNGFDGLDALFAKRSPVVDPTLPETPPAPGHAPDHAENQYVSYTTLPNGSVYRSPWVDYPLQHADQVMLGNRGLLSAKLDEVFRGWRTSRIMEMQKGALYRRLDALSPTFTPMQIGAFHEALLDLARQKGFVGVQPLGLSAKWTELPGLKDLYGEVVKTAEQIFGKGPYLGRDGKLVEVNWGREIAKAYRTAYRLNLTSGITSQVKSMGYGAQMALISDIVYPAFRFALSPLFKAGEWAEAPLLNAMRGVNPFGMDDAARALWQRGGLPTSGAEYAENALVDPMLAAAGRSRTQAVRQGWLSAPPPPGYSAEVARRRAGAVLTPGEELQPPSLLDRLFPMGQSTTREFPDLPTHTVEALKPHTIDASGQPRWDPARMRELDAARLSDFIEGRIGRFVTSVVDSPDPATAIENLALGMGYLETAFTPEELRRLALNVPIIHSVGSSGEGSALNHIENWLRDGLDPLSGPAGRGRTHLKGTMADSGETTLVTESGRSQTGVAEELSGFVDAPYAGQGVWNSDTVQFILRNERVLPRSVITTGDRISLVGEGPTQLVNKYMVSANGAVDMYEAQIRLRLLDSVDEALARGGSADKTLGDVLAKGFGSTLPVEHAFPNGGTWDDIGAIMLSEPGNVQRWNDLVAMYGDKVPALRNIEVLLADKHGFESEAWKWTFERSGLSDRYAHTFQPSMVEEGRIPSIIPNEVIVPRVVGEILPRLENQLAQFNINAPTVMPNIEDQIAGRAAYLRTDAANDVAFAAKPTVTKVGYGPEDKALKKANFKGKLEVAKKEAAEKIARADTLDALAEEMRTWRASTPIADEPTAARILADPKASPADKAAAAEFQTQLDAFRSRYDAAAGTYSSLDPNTTTGPSSIFVTRNDGGAVDPRGVHGELPAAPWTGGRYSSGTTAEQDVVIAKAVNDRLAQLRGDSSVQRPRWTQSAPASWSNPAITSDFVAPGAFTDELQRLASVKTGRPEPAPAVKVWLRGTNTAMTDVKGAGDFVITVSYPDGSQPLTLAEIGDAWIRTGLPDQQAMIAGGAKPDVGSVAAQQHLLWTPEGGQYGSIIPMRRSYDYPSGRFDVNMQTGKHAFYLDQSPVIAAGDARPVEILYHFDHSTAPAWWNLTDDMAGARTSVETGDHLPSVSGLSGVPDGTQFRWSGDISQPGLRWAYGWEDRGSYYDVQLNARSGSRSASEEGIRDLLGHLTDKPVRLTIDNAGDMMVVARLKAMGDLPDNFVLMKKPGSLGTRSYDAPVAITPEELGAMIPRRPKPPAVPDSLEEVQGSAEAVTAGVEQGFLDRIREATGARKQHLQSAYNGFWNPIPYKQMQQDRMIRALTKDWFPDVLAQHAPKVLQLYTKELRVPPKEIVDFLLTDRALLDRWIQTGSSDDFVRLVAHADKYHPASPDARSALDSLYESPDWQTAVEMMRWTAKAASDEAFAVHFFNPYRSTFERSINHPLLGVYPASWSYKVAKEWFRFLYKNETFGFRLGMQPARAIAQMQAAQANAMARDENTRLSDFLNHGPLGSTFFIFNLIMPGDWSGMPFPLSRSLRDMLRGDLNPIDHFRNNLTAMGLGRDVRLAGEVANEWYTLAAGKTPPRRAGEQPYENAFRR